MENTSKDIQEKYKNYYETTESVMSNFDHEINRDVEKELIENECYADYPGWGFFAQVVYDRDRKLFICYVNQYHCHVDTIEADTLEEIMETCCNNWGYE